MGACCWKDVLLRGSVRRPEPTGDRQAVFFLYPDNSPPALAIQAAFAIDAGSRSLSLRMKGH